MLCVMCLLPQLVLSPHGSGKRDAQVGLSWSCSRTLEKGHSQGEGVICTRLMVVEAHYLAKWFKGYNCN